MDPILIVDNAAGVYAWDCLLKRYPLYTADGTPIVKAEFDLNPMSSPDFWADEIDWLMHHGVSVKDTGGTLYAINQGPNGDLFAYPPDYVDLDDF